MVRINKRNALLFIVFGFQALYSEQIAEDMYSDLIVKGCPPYYEKISNTECKGIKYLDVSSNINDYTFVNNGMNGTDAFVKVPNCSGKSSSMGGGVLTPIYENNGVCYSDMAMYCKTHATDIKSYLTLSNGRVINCWDTTQTCNDARFGLVMNYSGNADKCSKFNYSCNNITRYGLAESPHPQNILPNPYVGANGFDNPTVLFDRITDKFNKTLIPSNLDKIVAKQDILINDNFGSMCVENIESNYLPTSKDYIIDSKTKSGF